MGKNKYTYEQVKDEFENKGYELISNEFHNVSEKLNYLFKKHMDKGIQKISFSKLHNCNQGCYYCGREKTENAHKIKLNKDYDKKLCESKNFKYIDTIRENGKIVIIFICNNHIELGEQHMPKYNMERDIKGCKYCSGKQLPSWYILKKSSELNPNIILLEPYKNLTSRIKCFCTKHNTNTNKTMKHILQGQGCYYCGIEKLSKSSYLSLNEFQKRVSEKSKNVIALEYNGSHQKAKFKCKLCEFEWESNATSMITTGKQCPRCMNYYNGEHRISTLLDKWGIEYQEQFRFPECRDIRPLPFDFYLLYNNVCIEFDGQQHFIQRNGWTKLEEIKKHDKIKDMFCKNNNIDLIRIPYWEQDDIEYYLFDKLVSYNVLEEIENTA